MTRPTVAILAGAAILASGATGAYSAAQITGRQIADGTVTARDLAPPVRKALTYRQASVAGNPVVSGPRGPQGEPGPAGAPGPQGPVGPAGPKSEDAHRYVESAPLEVTGGRTVVVLAACELGERAVSGGYAITSGVAKAVISRPIVAAGGGTAWQVLAENQTDASTALVRAYAVCAS